MHRTTWRYTARAAMLAAVLATGSLVFPATTHASHAQVNMDVTLSVYTCCGSLEGFNDSDPTHLFSIHNIYAPIWSKKYPGLKWKETLVNDQAQLETKLTLAVNSGNPPDMVFIQGGYIGDAVVRKLAQPLDQYFKNIPASYFLPGMVSWARFGGHWWAIPAVSGPLAGQLVYVPKYMTPLGYNNSNLRTFNDLYNMSKKAVKFDSAGNLTRIGYWPASGLTANVFETTGTLMCPPGHGLYNTANQPTATDPCNVAFLTYLKKLSDLYGGYTKISKFISGDPDIWSGSPKTYMATGKGLITPSANAYWSITPFDNFTWGIKGGLDYQLTPIPPSIDGKLSTAANFPSTQQEIIIPRGAKHPDQAFLASKLICWDYGYLLGPSTNGSPVAKDQERWLQAFIAGEAAARKKAGLSGNPAASLEGIRMQPLLARNSKAHLPINPVEPYYQEQLSRAATRVLLGQQSPEAALAEVQRLVLNREKQLASQYGSWNW